MAGAREVHDQLSGLAVLTRLHPPQSSQLSGSKRAMMLNAAYLLDANEAAGFATRVAAEASAHPELELDLTGPWPPYSFTAEGGDGEAGEEPPPAGQDP